MRFLSLALFIALIAPACSQQSSINVDHTSQYQEFYGCGASWTDSSAWLMYGNRNPGDYRALTDGERDAIYADLFGQSGIALKIVRQPMGTSDFRWSDYSYADVQGGFSISRDQSYIIPALDRTLIENNQVKVMALPWSPPAWMKQNGSLNGGSLKSNAFGDLGQYFADFVQAYEAEGIPIWAVSIQNEPMHEANDYPTMKMTEAEHAQAIVSVRAALGSGVKVVGYDHNWVNDWYPTNLLDYHPSAKAALSAIAFHCYESAPMPEVQTNLKNAHPEVEIFFTECTESGSVTSFNQDFRWALGNLVIGTTRNWASTVLEWNLLLDGYGGPKISGGCSNCRGLIDIVGWDVNNLQYVKRPAYYALGHLSKFAAIGARRIDSSQPDSNIKTVAMVNPDNTALLIVLNDGWPDKTYNVNWFDLICPLTVPSWSAVTLFRTPGSNAVQVWATYDQRSERLTRVADISCTPTGLTPAPTVASTAIPTAPIPPPSPTPVTPPTPTPVQPPTPSPVQPPTPSPVQLPTPSPVQPPTPSPVQPPTPSPVQPPTPSPVQPPTPSPVQPPTPSPVISPTSGIQTTGVACCSQDGINCLHANHNCELKSKCGINECSYVFWLPNGVPVDSTICTARYQGGCNAKGCCPGLGCVSNTCSVLVPVSPTSPVLAPTPAPVSSPTPAPVSSPTPAPVPPPTLVPVPPPTLVPVPPRTPAPIPPPTPAPVPPPTQAPVKPPTPAPVPPPTPAPMTTPTSGIPTTGKACCSQDGVTCLHAYHNCELQSKCGISSDCLYVFWLPNGVPVNSNSCIPRYQGNCNSSSKPCCPGLTCSGNGWMSCQLV